MGKRVKKGNPLVTQLLSAVQHGAAGLPLAASAPPEPEDPITYTNRAARRARARAERKRR